MSRPSWRAGASYTLNTILEPDVLFYSYKVTTAGVSGTSEPDWPESVGATVTDGTVVWTAVAANTITWTAQKQYTSGHVEPVWPTNLGATIVDDAVTWTARSPMISDAKCPHSSIAITMASKIFSPYRDVVRFCVTNNPRDWTTEDDAGFLPSGLQASESHECTALAQYRGRLVIFTASDLIVYTVDPDPAEMALFDNIPGLGTRHARGMQPVGGDLYFTTDSGVRSLTVAAGSTNLAAGDIGSMIDPLIVEKLESGAEPVSSYYPGRGQFWLIFADEIFVYSKTQAGKLGTWSRYTYPWRVTGTLQLDNQLYLRNEFAEFFRVDEAAFTDDGVGFEGIVWTPYLENGAPGLCKQLESFDIVGYGLAEVSFGYDQTNDAAYTTPYAIGKADTTLGGCIPMPLSAPSLSVKLRFPPGQSWQLNAMTLYLNDMAPDA